MKVTHVTGTVWSCNGACPLGGACNEACVALPADGGCSSPTECLQRQECDRTMAGSCAAWTGTTDPTSRCGTTASAFCLALNPGDGGLLEHYATVCDGGASFTVSCVAQCDGGSSSPLCLDTCGRAYCVH